MQLFLSKSFFLLNMSCTFAIEIKKHHKKFPMNMIFRPSKETYIWDEGYAYPTEQERMMTFVSSCIESVALALKESPSAIFQRMNKVGLIHDYLMACYDTLHTESRENVTADVIETLKYWEEKKGGVR